jgi:hypothetical protein
MFSRQTNTNPLTNLLRYFLQCLLNIYLFRTLLYFIFITLIMMINLFEYYGTTDNSKIMLDIKISVGIHSTNQLKILAYFLAFLEDFTVSQLKIFHKSLNFLLSQLYILFKYCNCLKNLFYITDKIR